MDNPESVDVSKRSVSLVSIQLNEQSRDRVLHLIVVLKDSVNSLGNVVHYDVQIYFVWLLKTNNSINEQKGRCLPYLLVCRKRV
jgi:hypothetical protein